MSKSIRQSAVLNATPAVVYEMLMDSKKHARFSGAPARISRKEGGEFRAYGAHLLGRNVELVAGKRIVQAWRGADWPTGVYSIVTFELAPAAGGKTKLTFTQHGVPDKNAKSISKGWKLFYWKAMAVALSG